MPGGTTRTCAAARFRLSGILSWNSNGPTTVVVIARSRK
jgi:hypothetical protein